MFRKMKTETILKLYNTLVLITFLYGSENWTLTASQRRRIEAAEMKLLRPLAGHTVNDHKTIDSIRRKLQTESILDRIDEYRRNWLLHLQRMPQNQIPLKSYHYSPQEREHLGDRRNVGESSCNSGDGTGQMAQPLMFMMMITCMALGSRWHTSALHIATFHT
jgi:hypothetical protein